MNSVSLSKSSRMRKTGWRVPLGFVSVLAGGCAATAPIDAWQQQVEGILVNGEGPNFDKVRLLGELGLRTRLRPGLIVVGDGDAGRGRPLLGSKEPEVRGVLVEVVSYGSRDWLVFLLGVVRRDSTRRYHPDGTAGIEDIRPVGLAFSGAQPTWVVGPADPEAARRYRSGDAWASSGAGERRRHGFPRWFDAFEVVEAPGGLNVCEAHTGACWALSLPAGPTSDADAEQLARVD